MSDRFIGFFFFFQLNQAYWELSSEERQAFQEQMQAGLAAAQMRCDLYQVFPLHPDVDLLLWCSAKISTEEAPEQFFHATAELLAPYRRLITPRLSWWGMTRPSDYSRGKSAQEIDPIEGQRCRYLIVYPFVKTAEWYKLSRDTRQGMMNEHIRMGHQYPEIKQLLLYSTGFQDQEFIVTYETEDIAQFSSLVSDLRGSEARRYTLRDTPVFTAIFRRPEETLKLFA